MAPKPRLPQKYNRERYGHYVPLNKKITNRWQVSQIEFLCEKWGLTPQEVCYRLILDGLHLELEKRNSLKMFSNTV